MKKIVLVACGSQKLDVRSKAEHLYISPLFKKSLAYAKSLNPDLIVILSAKHGVLQLNKVIDPYNETLNKMSTSGRKAWASKVIGELNNLANLNNDEFIFLAGDNYRKYLIPHITHYSIPMQGLRIGEQLKWLNKHLNNEIKMNNMTSKNLCPDLHDLFRRCKRYTYPYDESTIPKNGIYVFFEEGEQGHDGDRIVRVGTHTGKDQLRSRIRQHLLNQNKDRSIFRKNIGRALLNKDDDSFIEQWNWDMTTRANKVKYGAQLDTAKLAKVEAQVSNYMRNNFSFIVFEVNDKVDRLFYEEKIIATVSNCNGCGPSKGWLGNYSPKPNIVKSGLWLERGLWKDPLTQKEFNDLTKLVLATCNCVGNGNQRL